ncbi:MAG: hypothetical protein PVH29_01295 [Candidatus Zixiibacteriota bacterium]|jgi:hypothetical protein
MATNVSSARRKLGQEDLTKKKVSRTRKLDENSAANAEEIQARIGQLFGRIASRVTLAPDRAAEIWARVKENANK